jgi:hypothetical protein
MWLLVGMLGLGQAADTAAGTGAAPAHSGNGTAQTAPAAAPAVDKKDLALKRSQAMEARRAAIDSLRRDNVAKAKAVYEERKAAETASSSQIVNEKLKEEATEKEK